MDRKYRITMSEKIYRLNYIGSKFQLLDWLTTNIREKTGLKSFKGKTFADLFAGTGIVSYHFRKQHARVLSNDTELYSSILSNAFTSSVFTEKCKSVLDECNNGTHIGYITHNYSPYGSERKFFTIENAQKIDYARKTLEERKDELTEDEYKFILASILVSADNVSNVPAVYGCFLKEFKAKATKDIQFVPIHNNTQPSAKGSHTYNKDVLDTEFLTSFQADIVYLDPPYNQRQYSKNYFPLNMIAKSPHDLETEDELKGKTGIPSDCFLSPFCKKKEVEDAFDILFRELRAEWIFLSYNSESFVSKEKMTTIMEKYGEVSIVEREYKRFKSYEYNKDTEIKEYLFCLHRHNR